MSDELIRKIQPCKPPVRNGELEVYLKRLDDQDAEILQLQSALTTAQEEVKEIQHGFEILSLSNGNLREENKRINEIALELSVLNNTLQKQSGDMPEKSVKNFTSEIRRLTDAIFDAQSALNGWK